MSKKQAKEYGSWSEELIQSDWTSMLRVLRGAEFETVLVSEGDEAYLVRARVTARRLNDAETEAVEQAAAEGSSPLLAARDVRSPRGPEETALEVEPGEFLQNLGSLALANRPPHDILTDELPETATTANRQFDNVA